MSPKIEKVPMPNGTFRYFLGKRLHRKDGPAYIHKDGTEYWYLHGEMHRIDGPAVIYKDGRVEWYLKNTRIKSAEHFKQVSGCTDEALIMVLLKFGEIK